MASTDWSALNDDDLELVRSSLVAAGRGPFFEDWEFSTLMGVTRAEVDEVVDALSTTPVRWPDDAPEFFGDAANNALVNLWGYGRQSLRVAPMDVRIS